MMPRHIYYYLVSVLFLPFVCLGGVQNLGSQTIMEKRELSQDEQQHIAKLIELSKTGQDSACMESILGNNIPIRVGVYAVIIKDNKILMVHTPSGNKNCINFPGGGVDSAEGLIEALKRECMEELGMKVEVGEFLYSSKVLYVHDDFPHNYMYHFYFLATTDDVVATQAELKAEWFSLTYLPLEAMLPIDLEFVATLI